MKEPNRLVGNGAPTPAPTQNRLASAIALSLPFLALAAAGNADASSDCQQDASVPVAGQPCARKSAPILISDTTIETFADGPQHALHAGPGQWLQANNVEAISHGHRDNSGQAPSAVMAEGMGSRLVFNGGIARSHGNLGNGAEMEPMQRFGTVTARNLGNVELNDVVVTNTLSYGNGVFVQGAGATASVTRGQLIAAKGVVTKDGGHAHLTNVDIRGDTQGISSEGGRIEMRGGSIAMEGSTYRGEAVLAGSGARVELDGVSVRATAPYQPPNTGQGFTGHGAYVIGVAEVHVRDSEIHVEGNAAAGVQVGYTPGYFIGGLATVTRSLIRADDGVGMRIWGADSRGQIKDSEIVVGVSGDGSRGLAVSNLGNAQVNDSTFHVHGDRAVGAEITGFYTSTKLDGVRVHTYGTDSSGVSISSFAHTQLDSSQIATVGSQSHALKLEGAATAHVRTARLETAGDLAHGVHLTGAGSALTALDLEINTQGAASHAIDLHPGTKLSLGNSALMTHGPNAHALRASTVGDAVRLQSTELSAHGNGGRAVFADTGLNLEIIGGRLSAAAAPAIELQDGHLTLNARDGSTIAGGGGLLRLHGAATAALSAGNGVVLEGDIHHTNGGTIVLGLHSQSQWRGATDSVGALTLRERSRWTLTGSSRVNTLTLDRSEIAFPDPATGAFTTLTVAGDFDAQGATIAMHAALVGDATSTDRLHILGDARGDAQVRVANAGGSGAVTAEGIRLIQVDNLSNAVFRLSGRAVAGPYEYFLHQGGIDPNDGDWYLRSVLTAPVVPPDPDPDPVPEPPEPPPTIPPIDAPVPPRDPTVDPAEPPSQVPAIDPEASPEPHPPAVPSAPAPVLRPEVAAYLAVQTAASMFDHSWHDRVGAPAIDGEELQGSAKGWARLARQQTRHPSFSGQLEVSTDTSILHLGVPVAHWGSRGQHQAGLMLASGQARHQVGSAVSGFDARGSSDGVAWGAYGTWRPQVGGANAYVDGWWQQARYRQSVGGVGLPQERWDAHGWTASLEVGAAWTVFSTNAAAMQIEPQMQLLYTDYRANTHTEANGTVVRTDESGGWIWRAGARISGQAIVTSGAQVQPFVTLNWRHGAAENAIALGGQRVAGLQSQNRWEVAPGAQIAFKRGWAAWGQLGLHNGDDGYHQVSGHIGVRRGW